MNRLWKSSHFGITIEEIDGHQLHPAADKDEALEMRVLCMRCADHLMQNPKARLMAGTGSFQTSDAPQCLTRGKLSAQTRAGQIRP